MGRDDTTEVVIPLMDVDTATVLTFKNISCSVSEKSTTKYLLENVSGTFRSGRLTAIIGPSGAGKSTLLNVLSGFIVKGVKGQILVNNQAVDRQRYRQLVAYNAQDVTLLPNITVKETLTYIVDLKLPSSVARIQKTKVVNEIISLLGLEKCAHNQARCLSGGEKKRLSIGQELVSNPRIMFFDEPTSGLDSESSYQVISYLRDLARQGRCVASVVHQPGSDLLELFDDIFVITEGHCLYKGTLEDMIPTFADAGLVCPQYFNRADYAVKIAAAKSSNKTNVDIEKVENLMKRMEPSLSLEQNGTQHQEQPSTKLLDDCESVSQYPISQWRQFAILTKRTMLGTVRNFMLSVLRFVGHIMFGLIVGTVYFNIGNDGAKALSNVALIILILLFVLFANAMTVVLTFPLEMAVFVREYKTNCYSIPAYFFSKIVSDFPLMLAGITCFQIIAYYMTGQPNELNRLLMFWCMCALMGWFSQVFGLLGGSIFPIDVSPFIVPTTMLPAVLFCGFFIRYDELFDVFKPLTYISPIRFTFEGLMLSLYGFGRSDLGCSEIFCYYRKPKKVLEMLDMENGNFLFDVGGVCMIIFLLHLSLYVFLRIKLR